MVILPVNSGGPQTYESESKGGTWPSSANEAIAIRPNKGLRCNREGRRVRTRISALSCCSGLYNGLGPSTSPPAVVVMLALDKSTVYVKVTGRLKAVLELIFKEWK